MRGAAMLVLGVLLGAPALPAQSVLDRSPNLAGTWTLDRGGAVFLFAHRFEFIDGGDEMFNVPTLTLALGLPAGLTAGVDFTSNSEVVPVAQSGNEAEYWLKRALPLGRRGSVAAMGAYNTAARSLDGALSGRWGVGPATGYAELRGFGDLFGSGVPGAAGAVGAGIRLTPYLELSADVGRVISVDSVPSVWSAGLGMAIPGTPHSFSLQATNGGALTLQGSSRRKVLGTEGVRYGFVFTVPLGTAEQWGRIFRPAPPAPPAAASDSVVARVEMRQIAFAPREVRIRTGQSVEWVNLDPVVHTATGDDGSWGSGLMEEGQRFVQRFDRPGRYPYHCLPHPMMTGVVIVE